MNPISTNQEKSQKLKSMKRLTLFLLILVAGLLYLSFVLDYAWLRAMSEAALVGGIADWFAIVALFKHPLGLPIPHTAIIPKSKDEIAKNLGVFIKEEFFNKENLRSSTFLKQINLKSIIQDFIKGEKRSFSLSGLTQALESKIPTLCEKIKSEEKNLRFLDQVNFSKIIGNALQSLQESASYDEIIKELVEILDTKFQELKGGLRNKLVDSWDKKLISFVTGYDDKIIAGIEDYINKLKNPNAEEIEKIKSALQKYIYDLFHNEKTISVVNQKIKGTLKSDTSLKILTAIMEHIEEHRFISTTFNEIIKRELEQFINDDIKLKAIERWIKRKIVEIIYDYSGQIAGFIENTIKSWDSQEISRKLELEVGKDLQFIRINGMVVGGIIGGIIYGIETLFLVF